MDLHCHLDLYPEPRQVVTEVIKKKIFTLSVTTTPNAWQITNSLGSGSHFIQTALGLHPQIIAERHHEIENFEQHLEKTHFVGEIGLDGSNEYRKHYDLQKSVFEGILQLCARAGGKILSIHSKFAAGDVVTWLRRNPKSGVPIFHWFSGNDTDLKAAVGLDSWFSIGPSMLRSKRSSAMIAKIPRNRILTETDGPFTRVGNRPQYPWDVQLAVTGLAKLWRISEAESDAILTENLKSLLPEHLYKQAFDLF